MVNVNPEQERHKKLQQSLPNSTIDSDSVMQKSNVTRMLFDGHLHIFAINQLCLVHWSLIKNNSNFGYSEMLLFK